MGLLDSQTYTPRFDEWRHTKDKDLYIGFIGDPLCVRLDLFIKQESRDSYVLRKIILPSICDNSGFSILPSEPVVYTSNDIDSLMPSFLKSHEEKSVGRGLESKTVLGITQYLGRKKLTPNSIALFAALTYQQFRKNFIS